MLEIDVSEEAGIHELSEDMDTVSARIGFFGEVLAAASEEKIKLDAAYRKWRAEIAKRSLKDDPKISEWKVKADIESDPKFTAFKEAEAKAEYNTVALTNLIVALKEKSPNLRSKGARERAELDSTNMTTRATDVANQKMRELREISQPSSTTKKQPMQRKGE
jgi:hypothetical protein